MSLFYIITIGFSIIGMIISNILKSKFNKYSKIPLQAGMSGADIARNMLDYYGLNDVQIRIAKGLLTDHYNPVNKTVNLSENVYHGRNIASAAVAAHECGHAVQHAEHYPFLKLRSRLVPAVKFASIAQQYLLFIAFVTLETMPQIMTITVIAFGITTLFSFITLPVEFDASKRALAWLKSTGLAVGKEYQGAKDALKWAALTYVVAALSSLVMFLYLLTKLNRD